MYKLKIKNELNYKRSMLASSQTEFKSFANSNTELMNETDIKAHDWVKNWCLRFPNITKTNINIIKYFEFDGGLAQSVERRNHNPCVVGSNPSPATIFLSSLVS